MKRAMPPQAPGTRAGERSVGHPLLYTPAEERFDRITRLAQHALCMPVTAIMLLSEGKQWFKSSSGLNTPELPEERALCAWAFEADGPTFIEDLRSDARTAKHALVSGAPGLRFYAAYPLVDESGWPVGGFCVADVKPRTLNGVEQQTLLDLAEIAQRELLTEGSSSSEPSLAITLNVARRESMIDPLTRVWNRRGAYVLLRNAFERADQRDIPVGLAALDINGFSEINRRLGHQIGDEVLRKFAGRLVNAVRGRDLVFRLLDDRFLVLLSDVREAAARKVVERVHWALSGTSVPTRGGNLAVAARSGLIVRAPKDDATIDQLVTRAEQRMTLDAALPGASAAAP